MEELFLFQIYWEEVTKKFLLKPIPLIDIIYSKITNKPVRHNAVSPTEVSRLSGLIFLYLSS